MHLLVLDASSVEIFLNNGEFVMTNQIFQNENYTDFEINQKNKSNIKNFNIRFINKTIN